MMAWFKTPKGGGVPDNIQPIQFALAELIKYYLAQSPNRDEVWSVDLKKCVINGVSLGDWRVTVEPIKMEEEK